MDDLRFTYRLATKSDANIIKELINEMYGIAYEIRKPIQIGLAIESKKEIYFLATIGEEYVGFSGASLNNDYYADIIELDTAVLDYIYVREKYRGMEVSYQLITRLLQELVNQNVSSAIMQVQTFNKQRFIHYALSDKNILKSTQCERDGYIYYDQILKIDDLHKVAKITLKDLMRKTIMYLNEE